MSEVVVRTFESFLRCCSTVLSCSVGDDDDACQRAYNGKKDVGRWLWVVGVTARSVYVCRTKSCAWPTVEKEVGRW